jgi:hypothetical protein
MRRCDHAGTLAIGIAMAARYLSGPTIWLESYSSFLEATDFSFGHVKTLGVTNSQHAA